MTTDPADELLDSVDDAILGQLRDAFAEADPPPADLDERAKFAIRLENLDFEVSRLFEDTLQGTGARTAERIRTITFEADRLTIMLTVIDPGEGHLRLEGWLAPAAPVRVELRTAGPGDPRGQATAAIADLHGRFAFNEVSPGLSQLAVHTTPILITAPVQL
jgi:hypothetical protein